LRITLVGFAWLLIAGAVAIASLRRRQSDQSMLVHLEQYVAATHFFKQPIGTVPANSPAYSLRNFFAVRFVFGCDNLTNKEEFFFRELTAAVNVGFLFFHEVSLPSRDRFCKRF